MSELGFLCPEQRLADFLQKKTLSVLYIISTIAKFSRQAWQNWILSVHGNFLKELDSARKNLVFSWFPDIGRNQRRFWRNFFSKIVKTASSGSGESLWWNTFLEEVFFTITLGHWEKKFQLFDERFSTGFQRSLSTCPGKLYEEYFWENLIFWN